jgi:hypothetical protein
MLTSFADFHASSLRDYIAAVRNTEAFWFFLHIPKTAGSSLSTEMTRMRPPYHNVEIDYGRPNGDHNAALAEAVARFARAAAADARCASGHVPATMLDPILEARPDTRLFTLLRDPVQRVVSDYIYQTTPAHPPHEAFRSRYPSLEMYALERSEQNKMTFFLAGERSAEADFETLYRTIVGRFSFIGLVELYPMSFNIAARLMGGRGLPAEHQRRTADADRSRIAVTPSTLDLIRRLNTLDQRLYDRVAGALLPKLAEWTALQAREPA